MPDVLSRAVKRSLQPRDLTWIGDHCVFGTRLPNLRLANDAISADALDDFKLDQMEVNRMRVLGCIVNLPDLGCSGAGFSVMACIHNSGLPSPAAVSVPSVACVGPKGSAFGSYKPA